MDPTVRRVKDGMHPRINDSNDAFLATGEGTGKEVLLFKVGIEPTAFVTAVGFGSSFKKSIPSALRASCGSVIRAPVCSTAT